jgi:1-acyl-sn-glycerol-3-phosphate acyltransferase
MVRNIILWFRSLFISIPLIVLGTFAAATLAIIASWVRPRSNALHRIRRAWARWILFSSFVRLEVRERQKIPRHRAVLFCSNHLSYLDPPALLAALDCPVLFLAKESLFRIPFFGWAMSLGSDIPIERDNPHAAGRSLLRAAEAARAGNSLVIFPEGERSPDGVLQPFLPGAFRLAIRTGAPVVPVAIRGSRAALRPGSLLLRGGLVRVTVGEVIAGESLALPDQDAVSALVRQSMSRMISAE